MSDWLAYSFLQRAVVAGLLAAVTCGVLGFFVLLRRLSFLGVGVSHAALGGVALGLVMGVEPVLAAAVFAALVAWSVGWLGEHGNMHEDTAVGVLFSAAMALGVAILSASPEYRGDLFGYLFGNILAVTSADLWLLGSLSVAVLTAVALLFKELLFASYDEEVARASGLPVTALHYFLLGALALTVVVAMRVVGVILVEALLVIPAATAYQWATGYRELLVLAIAFSVLGTLGGLLASYWWNVAAGASIVLVLAAVFTVSVLARRARRT